MFIQLATWYLKRKKVSIVMNCDITGGTVKQRTNRGVTINCDFVDAKLIQSDGVEFEIPKGKFKIVRPSQEVKA